MKGLHGSRVLCVWKQVSSAKLPFGQHPKIHVTSKNSSPARLKYTSVVDMIGMIWISKKNHWDLI